MLHPATELRYVHAKIGYGIFATAPIPTGTLVWVADDLDLVIRGDQVADLPELMRNDIRKFSYRNKDGSYTLPWDLARYVNHSCDANVRDLGYVGGIAVRDIHPDDEITGELSTAQGEPFVCHCQSAQCRGTVHGRQDIQEYWQRWDERLRGVLHLVREVPQPILRCVKKDAYSQAIIQTLLGAGESVLPSHKDFL